MLLGISPELIGGGSRTKLDYRKRVLVLTSQLKKPGFRPGEVPAMQIPTALL